jgi:hypothetical protein
MSSAIAIAVRRKIKKCIGSCPKIFMNSRAFVLCGLSLEESAMSSAFQEEADIFYTIIINNKINQKAIARKII